MIVEAPTVGFTWDNKFTFANDPEFKNFSVTRQFGDTAYYKTFGMQLAAGRFPFIATPHRK